MTLIEQYKRFLELIGWDEFNNVEKEYFFDELNREPNFDGVILRILPNEKKKNYLLITHIGTGYYLDIPQREIKNFRKWIENTYTYGEDGTSFFACKEAIEKEKDEDQKKVIYDYDLEQKVLSLLFKYYSLRDISKGIPFVSKKGLYRADFVVYANNDVNLIIEVKRKGYCTSDNFSNIADRLQAVNKSVTFVLTDGDIALYSRIGEKYRVDKLEVLLTKLSQSRGVENKVTIAAIRSHLTSAITSAKNCIANSDNIALGKERKEKERKLKSFVKGILAADVHRDEKDQSTWCLNTEKEREFFQILLGEYKGDYILKFSSLRSLLALIDNESLGMCSLICMNDPGEKDYADNKVNKRENEESYADTFIISGGKDEAENNLTMWRLYGGDAKGICLKFRIDKTKLNKNGFYLAPVSYADANKKHYELEIIKNICTQSKDKKWNFDFAEWNIWKHFFKDNAYDVEEEIRLLFMPNPYLPISDSIWFTDDRTNIYSEMRVFDLTKDTAFPLTLDKIILGTNFPAYPDNTRQFNRRIAMTKIRTTKENKGEIVSHCDDIDNYKS